MKPNVSKMMLLIAVILMDLLAGMEFDLFVPSFPELQTQFNLSPFLVETLLSINFIGFCLSLFFVGSLADRYGRKPIITLGILIFIIGSIFCLWGSTYLFLILGRFLQGIGIAAPAILSFLIIADAYPLKQQQYLMAMLNGLMNAAAGGAPVIGSYITLYFHWQGNFLILLLLGLFTFMFTLLFIPSYKRPETKETLSWRGYIPLFQSRPLVLLLTFIIMNFVPYWVFVGMSPLLYIKDLHVSLSHFGYYQGALALTFGLGSIAFGFILNKFDQKKMLYVSGYIFLGGLISIAWITVQNSHNPLLITVAFLPFIIGQIIPSAILHTLCLNFMPQAKGRVSAVLQGGRLILCALSLQLAGFYYSGTFQNIGIILSSFMLIVVITIFLVINNRVLMKRLLEH
ncbi:MAG: MFS transporter [Legionellaceae bacterium]|nr:MFS transporter [Legionellaceae bacterium]